MKCADVQDHQAKMEWRSLSSLSRPSMVHGIILSEPFPELDASDNRGRTALIWAAERVHLDVAALLLEEGADVNAMGKYQPALHYASRKGHYELVRLLHKNDADINASGFCGTALHEAPFQGHTEIANLLLSYGTDTNRGRNSGYPIQWRAGTGNVEIMKILPDKRLGTGPKCRSNQTPLHKAAARGHLEIVKMLVKRSVDLNAINSLGRTPLLLSVANHHLPVSKMLLENGADVNFQRRNDESRPPHIAAKSKDHEMTSLLLNWEADVHALDCDPNTSLLVAISTANVQIVQKLLESGADVKAPSKMPLQLATSAGDEECRPTRFDFWGIPQETARDTTIKILEQKGADA